ncbi:MAG: PEP-CTERM sorting domain-containing protein, partial [Myxococcota bacterium]
GVTGGEYGNLTGPGSPGLARNMAEDGHFIDVTATVTSVAAIPEPGTALLLAVGLVGIAAQRRRS